MVSSVDLVHYGVSRAKDWVSGCCGTNVNIKRGEELNKLVAFVLILISFVTCKKLYIYILLK